MIFELILKPFMCKQFNQKNKVGQKLKIVSAVEPKIDENIPSILEQGLAFHHAGKLEQARVIYEEILKLNPKHFDALQLLGVIAIQAKQLKTALRLINDALNISTANPVVYNNRGIVLNGLKLWEDALASFDLALEKKPDYVDAYINRGNVLQELNRHTEALLSYESAAKFKPDYAVAYLNCGNAMQELMRPEEALANYNKAIAIKPNYAEAYSNRGLILQELNLFEQALASYSCAIEIKPDFAEAYFNRANILQELDRMKEALADYNKAIEIKLDFAEAYCNCGLALQKLNSYEEALVSYARAIEIRPDYAEAYSNRGDTLLVLNRCEEALDSYDWAIKIKPDFVTAYLNRGNALKKLNFLAEAIISYKKAIEINPDFVEAHNNLGNAFKELKNLKEAAASYDKAIEIKPDYEYVLGTNLHTKMQMCNWHDYEANVENLLIKITEGNKSSPSMPVLAVSDSLSIQGKTTQIWMNDKRPLNTSLGPITKRQKKQKIKIGYYSEDFREHPVAYLAVELFELHNKNLFELFAFYYGPADSSNMHKRVELAFDTFIDIRLISDKEVAELSRDLRIDIAIDLTGLTGNERAGIFACRAAPIQLSYLGYLGTMGVKYYDYLLADKTLIPVDSKQYYEEKIVYLPSYQVNDSKRLISDKVFEKKEYKLPVNGFVFCSFSNNYKINPSTFDGWMRILSAVPDSVLFLYKENELAEANLKLEAEKRGVSQNRLVFGGRIARSEYLARYRLADLFLDTMPYNSGTTASDALWAGLPVLTCLGESFASRMAASLLNAIELPELITKTQSEYEATAIELATNPVKLKAIKDKLARNRLTTALFDTPRFTKNIEAAYIQMYERYQDDLPPDIIYI